MTGQLQIVDDREGVGYTHFVAGLESVSFDEPQRSAIAVPNTQAPSACARSREREWLRWNSAAYAGKWVAIEGDRLLSYGDDARAVLQRTRAKGVQHPLLVQIGQERPLPFGGW